MERSHKHVWLPAELQAAGVTSEPVPGLLGFDRRYPLLQIIEPMLNCLEQPLENFGVG